MELGMKFLKNRRAATAVEYGLIITLVAVAVIAGVTALGTSVNGKFSSVSETVAK